ncbi:MAG: hypothetical protein K2X47_04060 [Bdellovibrionales bacterium]|nr:hypothetical protein [Bdellovibrionales bacterium]
MSPSFKNSLNVFLLAVVISFEGYAQKLVTPAELTRTQISSRALQESLPGQIEFPRLIPLKGMARVSQKAKTRTAGRVAVQPNSELGRLVKSARAALGSLRDLSLSIGRLYRGKAYLPPGLNYFTVKRGRISDENFQKYLKWSGKSPQQVLDIVEITISFEQASDLYLAIEGLLRADARGFIEIVGFRDSFLTPLKDQDRQVELRIRKDGHVSTLRLEVESYLMARAYLKNDRRLANRQRVFKKAQEIAEKNYLSHRAQIIRYNAKVGPQVLKQLEMMTRSVQNFEREKTMSNSSLGRSGSGNLALNNNPDGVLCPNWNQVSVDHNMASADKLRTFIWGLSQPPCSADRIRSGHLLYKQIFDSYVGFEFSKNPQQHVQQALLKSVYLSTADYLRARPTAAQNQMCRPEEKIRIYRGVGAMPLFRPVGAKTAVHLAPLFGDQLQWGLQQQGLTDPNSMPKIPNRDLGEMSFERMKGMSNLTWDFIEGVPHGWKFVLGLHRSTGWQDANKDGIPEEDPIVDPPIPFPNPGPVPPFSPQPIAEPVSGNAFSAVVVNKATNEEPLPGSHGVVPSEEPPSPTEGWNEPGKNWYRLNGQLQRVLAWHTSTSTYSPFLSASFSESMGRGYGPLMIVMDVCPERILPNYEPTGAFLSEEELYIPFFVLPEEIVRIEGRECWLARSKPGINEMTPEQQEKHFEQAEKICQATYNAKEDHVPEAVNASTQKWRTYFRNFRVNLGANDFVVHNPQHLQNSQNSFYGLLAQGLAPSALNPLGEMTLARWRDIARNQVRGFQNCQSSKFLIQSIQAMIDGYRVQIKELQERIKKFPDPSKEFENPNPVPEPPLDGGIVEPMPAAALVGAGVNSAMEEPLPPEPPVPDWRKEQIKEMEKEMAASEGRISEERKLSAGRCGSL